MKYPSSRFTIVAILTIFAGIIFVATWVHAVRSDPDARGDVPELSSKIMKSGDISTVTISDTASSSVSNSTSSVSDQSMSAYPQRLKIPSLGIDAAIQRVGITKKGNMGIPSNFTDVGWYAQGTMPGKSGNALIDGHVDNALGLPGVFSKLDALTVGDDVYVDMGKGKKLHFKVTNSTWYSFSDVPMARMIFEKNVKGLKLITCGGTWIQDKKMYDRRLVVSAVLVE